MAYIEIIWDLVDDPQGNVQHIARNGLSKEEVEFVIRNPESWSYSRTSGDPIVFGKTEFGLEIAVVYEDIDEFSVRPVTAFRVE